MFIEFNDDLLTGNHLIDTQHKEWIDRINAFLHTLESSGEKLAAVKALDFLADYSEFHFNAEEKLQAEIQYPGIGEHKAKHQQFRDTVAALHEMLEEEEGPSDAFVARVKENVVNWLYSHIQGFDRSVAEYKNMRSSQDLL